MTTQSLSPETMEKRVARFNKLQTYQQQNFATHGIPAGAVEKITARKVYPVMAPADYQGRSVPETAEQADPISYAPSLAKEIEDEYGKSALEGLQKVGFKFEEPTTA